MYGQICKETNTTHMNDYNPVRKKSKSQVEYMTGERRKAVKLKREARNEASTQTTACECLCSCGWDTDVILSFRVATQRRKMIMYKTPSVPMIKINQKRGTILGNKTGDIFTAGPHGGQKKSIQRAQRCGTCPAAATLHTDCSSRCYTGFQRAMEPNIL